MLKKLPKFCDSTCKCIISQTFDIKFLNFNNAVIITDRTIFDNLFYQIFCKIKPNIDADDLIILPSGVKPYKSLCKRLAKQMVAKKNKINTIIAIGSGTINDIAKYTSFCLGVDYIIIPSALSMNGYTSSTASLIFNGLKQSVGAHLAKECIFCLDILSQSPAYLTNSGILDCLATIPAHFDWYLSSIFHNDIKYNTKYLRSILPHLTAIINDKFNIKSLINAIVLSGFAMTHLHSSTPASGSEHILAHTSEMFFGKYVEHLTHGQLVGIFLNDVLKMQADVLQKNSIKTKLITSQNVNQYFTLASGKIDDIIALKSNLKTKLTNDHKKTLRDILKIAKNKNFNDIIAIASQDGSISDAQREFLYEISHLSRDRLTVLDIL